MEKGSLHSAVDDFRVVVKKEPEKENRLTLAKLLYDVDYHQEAVTGTYTIRCCNKPLFFHTLFLLNYHKGRILDDMEQVCGINSFD